MASRSNSLVATLAVYLLSPLALNGIIFGLHWNSAGPPNPMLPPGAVVGSIWMLLFLDMGVARWIVARRDGAAARWPDALAIACMLYPLYTLGLRSLTIGFAGTCITFALALVVAAKIRSVRPPAAALISLVIAWLAYAGVALGTAIFH